MEDSAEIRYVYRQQGYSELQPGHTFKSTNVLIRQRVYTKLSIKEGNDRRCLKAKASQ